MKPHHGIIEDWEEIHHPKIKELFPESLGYKIKGVPIGHPNFIGWIITSAVLKKENNEIETLNSRYTLGKSHSQAPP